MSYKKILTVQDISCVGQCSLTVALPIISACGVEASVLPSAVLSTHTAGFKGYTFRDLSDDMPDIVAHWKKEGISFDAIYTGYLGSEKQIDYVKSIFATVAAEGCVKVVDPAMADNGSLYPGFDMAFASAMASLCAEADYVIPNITEAAYMLGIPYNPDYDEEYIRGLLRSLTTLGCPRAALTGIGFTPDQLGCYGYDAQSGEFFFDYNEKKPQSFHGTGDIFASVCFSNLMGGSSLCEASALAADFVCDSIDATVNDEKPIWYGVNFEKVLKDR